MRRALILLLLLSTCLHGFSQHNLIDSLQLELKKEKTDTGKAVILFNLSYAYAVYKPDSALLFGQQAYDLSVKHKFLSGESNGLDQIAGAFLRMGDNAQALAYYIRVLKIEEERNFPDNLAAANMNIALVYNREKDTANAIYYILRTDSIIRANNLADMEMYTLLNTGDILEKANRLQDALTFTQRCYTLAVKNHDSLIIGSALNNLGNIYAKTGDVNKAIMNYRAGVIFLQAANDNQTISEGQLGMAKVFQKDEAPDSALEYAAAAFHTAAENGFLENELGASLLLSQLYKKQHIFDSAFSYREIADNLKDSIGGIEKIKQLEGLSIEEKLRQQHLLSLAAEEKEENRERLELLAIGILIPLFFLMTLYISRRRVHPKLIEYSGIISLLLFFEYITLLIHPFVSQIAHHSPVFEIIILVAIAAIVVPAHHRVQHWFVKRLGSIHERHTVKPNKPSQENADSEKENGENFVKEESASAEVDPGEALSNNLEKN